MPKGRLDSPKREEFPKKTEKLMKSIIYNLYITLHPYVIFPPVFVRGSFLSLLSYEMFRNQYALQYCQEYTFVLVFGEGLISIYRSFFCVTT